MKEIDRRGRTLTRVIMWGLLLQFLAVMALALFTAPDEDVPGGLYVLVALMVVFYIGGTLYCAHYKAPRAYFSDEGVYLKYFFRKYFHPWGDVQQAMVLERSNNKGTWYEFYLLTWDGSPWEPGDRARSFIRRNRAKNLLRIPLTDESREYVKKHHGRLLFDESDGKYILWRLLK